LKYRLKNGRFSQPELERNFSGVDGCLGFSEEIQIPSVARKIIASLEIARYCHRIVPVWRAGLYLKVYSGAWRICRRRRFEPREAFRLGLFRPDFDSRCLCDFISRRELTKIQERLNPPESAELAKNKGMFYYHCLKHGIPVPQLFVVCQGPSQKWQCNPEGTLSTTEEKKAFLLTRLPQTFVIKPVYGAYGKDVYVFCREENRFVDNLNKPYSAEEFCALTESVYPDGFIIQQKVENHPSIVELTGCEALQTARIITFVADDKAVRLLHSHFKTITKPGIVIDTHIEGLAGNVEIPVEIESGIFGPGNQIVSTGQGIITIANHPITGRTLVDFQLPFWRQVCEMVKHAAVSFLPLRTIGWDVAFSRDKTCIIEANVWWDAPNQHRKMSEILKQIQGHLYEDRSSRANES
jgi:hypothetical protein